MRSQLLGLFIAFPYFSLAMASQPLQPTNANSISQAVENFAFRSHDITMAGSLGSLICPLDTEASVANQLFARYAGSHSTSLENFWANTRCQDLFSDRPPPWFELLGNRFPSRVNGGIPQFLRTNWTPVCSMSMLWATQNTNPRHLPEETLDDLAAKIHETDGCERPNNLPAVTSASHTPHRVASDRIPMRSEKERADIMALAPGLQARARDQCCAANQPECRQFFDAIEITWCDFRCNEGGAELAPLSAEPWARNWQRLQAAGESPEALLQLRNQIEFPNFRITLDPRTHRADGTALPGPRNHGNILNHELGHACSTIQRALAAKNGTGQGPERDTHAILHYIRHYGSGNAVNCDMDYSFGAESYTALFNRFSPSNAAVSCLVDSIRHFPRNRFQAHWGRRNDHWAAPLRRPCQETCQVMHLEESFADYFSMMLAPSAEDLAQWASYRCSSLRDVSHPASVDLFRCLSTTAEFRQRLEHTLGCQP